MTIYRGIYIPVSGPPEVKRINTTNEEICRLLEYINTTRLIYQRMGQDDLPPIRGPVILVDDYRKLSLKDLCKLLKIPYNKEWIENASRKMLEDVQSKKSPYIKAPTCKIHLIRSLSTKQLP
ncbi:5430_t:CDS:2 [Diversispora eburnea]|uniref:5430_t:CDS:1 n=1 Tax=Diversispora eburnea TaxID=1213867 RepID=A0A9N9GL94_9GLOM|nr:5430_t:CDS:2 [Diversispora eburnea]